MASKVTRKITEALSDLLQAYSELLEGLQAEFGVSEDAENEVSDETSEELESSLVTEVRAALELVMDQDDYSADNIAELITSLTEALEEIDPTIFDEIEEEDDEQQEEDEDYVVEDDDEEYDEYEEDDEDYGDDDSYEDVDDLDD